MDGGQSLTAGECPFPGATGRGVRVAVIDSGVHAEHPHICSVAGGISIGESEDAAEFVDQIGHGTAVMAAIQEKAPDAEYFVVRVFRSELRTSIAVMARAIEWCLDRRIDVLNLSLGTSNPSHAGRLAGLIARAERNNAVVVSADNINGMPAFPGSLPGAFGVSADLNYPRDFYSYDPASGLRFVTSGYPRGIPGVPRGRNLNGISFAVANMSGFIARCCQGIGKPSYEIVRAALLTEADRIAALARH